MKGHTLLKQVLKRWEVSARKLPKESSSKLVGPQLQAIKTESGLLQALLLWLEHCFPKSIREQTILALLKLSESSEEARSCAASFFLLNQLMANERFKEKEIVKGTRKKKEQKNIATEAEKFYLRSFKEVEKQLKQLESRKIEKLLLKNFDATTRFEPQSFIKQLDQKREKLFSQVIEIIRVSQPADHNPLRNQVESFLAFLELSVEAGYEKGKRLLQVMEGLLERLIQIYDGERFREFLEETEREKSTDSAGASDVEKLRLIRTRLGVLQAHALQAFHAHLPVTLQVLKRRLPAIF
ncbi:MAG: hypothetical protein HY582_00010 [Candidatus Omnitrophica bacterium]|nr:hypothetical protein [Candidatus Omnitrophota bacterium]